MVNTVYNDMVTAAHLILILATAFIVPVLIILGLSHLSRWLKEGEEKVFKSKDYLTDLPYTDVKNCLPSKFTNKLVIDNESEDIYYSNGFKWIKKTLDEQE